MEKGKKKYIVNIRPPIRKKGDFDRQERACYNLMEKGKKKYIDNIRPPIRKMRYFEVIEWVIAS